MYFFENEAKVFYFFQNSPSLFWLQSGPKKISCSAGIRILRVALPKIANFSRRQALSNRNSVFSFSLYAANHNSQSKIQNQSPNSKDKKLHLLPMVFRYPNLSLFYRSIIQPSKVKENYNKLQDTQFKQHRQTK